MTETQNQPNNEESVVIIGTRRDDVLYGSLGHNIFYGGLGNDTFIETFAKFLSPNSRNLNTGFRLFLFRISTDSTQILPLIPLGYPIIRHPAAF